jgi:hypothetical protein
VRIRHLIPAIYYSLSRVQAAQEASRVDQVRFGEAVYCTPWQTSPRLVMVMAELYLYKSRSTGVKGCRFNDLPPPETT